MLMALQRGGLEGIAIFTALRKNVRSFANKSSGRRHEPKEANIVKMGSCGGPESGS
jgi:hypothetical protein